MRDPPIRPPSATQSFTQSSILLRQAPRSLPHLGGAIEGAITLIEFAKSPKINPVVDKPTSGLECILYQVCCCHKTAYVNDP